MKSDSIRSNDVNSGLGLVWEMFCEFPMALVTKKPVFSYMRKWPNKEDLNGKNICKKIIQLIEIFLSFESVRDFKYYSNYIQPNQFYIYSVLMANSASLITPQDNKNYTPNPDMLKLIQCCSQGFGGMSFGGILFGSSRICYLWKILEFGGL